MKALVLIFLIAALLPAIPGAAAVEPTLAAQAQDPKDEAAFSVGAPAGDAYNPSSLALDPGRNLAYVYHSTSAKGPAVIAVVDIAAEKVLRLIPIGDAPLGGSSRLVLTPDGRRLFLQENGSQALWMVDPQTGKTKVVLDRVRDLALSDDGAVLFVARDDGLAAYSAAELAADGARPTWQGSGQYTRLALNGGRLLAGSSRSDGELAVFDARTGASLASAPVAGANAVSVGAGGGWAAIVGGEKPRLIRYDAALKPLGETPIPYANDFSYDPRGGRFLVGGHVYEADSPRGKAVVLAIDAADGRIVQETRLPALGAPTVFAPLSTDALLALAANGPALLSTLDAGTLQPRAEIPMGARAEDLVLSGEETLYVADDLGRIHVVSLPAGEEVALWQGAAPLALDAANGRLYANRGDRVVALDLKDGSVAAEFGQGGYPAPDPDRDLVYIADRGVTMYDRSGKKLGELASTFPDPKGFSPNPYAYAVRVNPVTGHVAVILNNGIPGSNGGSFVRIYEPQSDKFVVPTMPHSFVMDLMSDSKGAWRVAYATARNQEAIQTLSPNGKEMRRLDHRTGFLALDEAKDDLYLFGPGRVTRLDASTLTALETFSGPDAGGKVVVAPGTATAYLIDRGGPNVRAAPLDALAPLDLKPGASGARPDANNYGLAAASSGGKRVLLAQFDGLYRSSDGKAWQQLLPGLELQYADVTVAEDGTIFVTGRNAMGGEGAWRSKDGGDTWEWLSGGLTDLAASGPMLARSADEAYLVNRGQGLLRWDPSARAWQLAEAAREGAAWDGLALAPDGTLFRSNVDNLETSVDRGASWTQLGETAETGEIIGFSALYTTTRTIFSVARADYRITGIQRSEDGGKTWQPALTSAQLDFDGPEPELVTGFGRTYLLVRPYRGEPSLLRTTDYGKTWQAAPAVTAKDVRHIAVDRLDGRLWLATNRGVSAVDPDKLVWTKPAARSVAVTAKTPPAPKPTARLTPTPTRGPCGGLTGQDAEVDARGLGIGCPVAPGEGTPMARQRFQKGQMIWREDLRSIYVIYDDGRWEQYADKWAEGDPADDPKLSAPPGLQQPVRGFGKVWREQLGGTKAKLGWALEKEQGVFAQAQEWTHGTVLRFGGEVIVLGDAGRWW